MIMINKKLTALHVFIFGNLIGITVFLLIYGVSVLSFTNVDWLLASTKLEGLSDLSQHYLGWVAFRNSPWHFPFGLFDGLYSDSLSITYTDSIPLFAIPFKLLSPLLPEQFQYFGLYGILSYALTGGFAALLLWFGTSSTIYSIIGSFFFVLSPVLTKRMFYHMALASPFLILTAFCLCMGTSKLKRNTWILLWAVLCGVAMLINPYYVPMVVGILLCRLLYELLLHKKFSALIAPILFSCGAVLICGFLTGMFSGSVSASANGLEDLSFNLLQFVNPANQQLRIIHREYLWETQNYSRFLPALPLTSPWQVEGFSYLGFGILILFAIELLLCIYRFWMIRYRTPNMTENISTHVTTCTNKRTIFSCTLSLLTGAIVFTLLALSPTATVLDHTLYHIAYPDTIYQLLSVFRSTGRLIWPVYYGWITLVLLGLYHLLKHYRKPTACIILCIGLLIQLVDLSPSLTDKHIPYAKKVKDITYVSPLHSSAWDILGTSCEQIVFYPPTHYGLYCDPYVSCTFVEYAERYGLICNISYLSRNLSAEADDATYAHFQKRKAGVTFPKNIYVFFDISKVPPASETRLRYYEIDGYLIGTELDLDAYASASPVSSHN